MVKNNVGNAIWLKTTKTYKVGLKWASIKSCKLTSNGYNVIVGRFSIGTHMKKS